MRRRHVRHRHRPLLEAAAAYATLAALRDGDPFVKAQVAQYEILPWLPNIGREDLDEVGTALRGG